MPSDAITEYSIFNQQLYLPLSHPSKIPNKKTNKKIIIISSHHQIKRVTLLQNIISKKIITLHNLSKMQFEESVKQLVSQARITLVQQLRNLDEQTKKTNRQQMCTKLKIIIGLISESSGEELEQEVKQFNDQDLAEVVKGVREKIANGGANAKTIVEPAPVEKPAQKRNDRIKEVPKKIPNLNRSNSILKVVLGKFIKEDENVRQMILPQKQVKHYYDKEKGKYVFEGEQEEQVKEIPKPPPAKKVNQSTTNPKTTTKPKQKGQLEEMMAPPAFKRKGMKKKEETVHKPVQVQCNFETLQQKIINELQDISIKILNMFSDEIAQKTSKIVAEKPPALPAEALSTLNSLKNFSDEIRSAQQISDTLMTRLYSSYIDSQSGIESLQNILQQIVKYQKTNTKIFHTLLETKHQNFRQTNIRSQQHQQTHQKIKTQQEQIQLLKLEIQNYKSQLGLIKKQLHDERQKYRFNLQSEVSENKMIKHVVEEKKNDLLLKQKEIGELVDDINRRKEETKHLKNQMGLLRQKLHNFETNLRAEQKQILDIIFRKSTQTDLMDEISETLAVQNDLYFSIQAKRMSLCTQGKQPTINHAPDQPAQSTCASLFELSDSFSKVVQHYEAQLSTLKKQHTSISESYQHLKSQSNRTHQNLTAQNQSLQRSITRLKSLIQTYKQQKQQSQLKFAQLENDNQSLHRQISHVRKQHNYTKQILEQNIRASHDNTITLKQQLEEDIKALQDKLEEKQLNQRMLNQEIRYKNQEIEEYIRQNKVKFAKISNLQKDLKNTKLELGQHQILCNQYQLKIQQAQREKQQIISRSKQEKNKYEENIKNNKNRLKQLMDENNNLKSNEKQLKKQNGVFLRSIGELKQENQEIMAMLEESNRENEDFKEQLRVANEEMSKKQEQISGLLEQQKRRGQYNAQNTQKLQQQLLTYSQIFTQMKQQMSEYKNLFSSQAEQIQLLMQQLYLSKAQVHQLQNTLLTKTNSLTQNLLASNQQTESICQAVREYENITGVMGAKIQQLEIKDKSRNQVEEQYEDALMKLDEYQQNIKDLEGKLFELGSAKNELEQLKSKVAEYQVQLYKKQKQITHLRNISTKISQLQQQKFQTQDKIQLLEQQRNSFEQITFEMQKELQQQRQDHSRDIQLYKNQIDQLRDILASKNKQNEENTKKYHEKQNMISELKRKCVEYQSKLSQNSVNQNLEKQFQIKIDEILEEKNCEILSRDQLIKQLNYQLSQMEDRQNRCKALQTIVEELNRKIEDLEKDNGECDQLIRDLSDKFKESQRILFAKQAEYAEKQKGFEDTVNNLLEQLQDKQVQVKKLSAQHEQQLKLLKQQTQKAQISAKNNEKHTDTESSNSHINGNGLSVKDKLINNIQSTKDEINKKIQQIQRLNRQLENKQVQLSKANQILDENKGNIEKLLLELEEKEQQVARLQGTVAELRKQLTLALKPTSAQKTKQPQPQQHQRKQSQILAQQQQQLQQLILAQDATITQLTQQSQKLTLQISKLTKELEISNNMVSQLGKQKNQLHELYIQKSEQADTTVEKLQAQIRDSQKYVVQYQALLAKYKDLELENGELLVEKSELLKTKNEILAKLAQRMQATQQHQENKPEPKQNDEKIKQQLVSKPQVPKKQEPSMTLNPKKQSETQAQKPGGFFGSLSSLFLTPTQNQKLSKARK